MANNAADAAVLYYDQEQYADGIKVFNKQEGNKVIKEILFSGFNMSSDLKSDVTNYLKDKHTYYVYYLDGNGEMITYNEGNLLKEEAITFPYVFTEALTGYKIQVKEPTVIVTINGGYFDYRLRFLTDPQLIRTSGYEYVGY